MWLALRSGYHHTPMLIHIDYRWCLEAGQSWEVAMKTWTLWTPKHKSCNQVYSKSQKDTWIYIYNIKKKQRHCFSEFLHFSIFLGVTKYVQNHDQQNMSDPANTALSAAQVAARGLGLWRTVEHPIGDLARRWALRHWKLSANLLRYKSIVCIYVSISTSIYLYLYIYISI